jgi:predicted short-subunit dehydrogenase-like oxidoreductase (DUF2520 family)
LAAPVLASPVSDLDDLIEDADLYLLCTSDDSIEHIAAQLHHVNGIVAHTSGAMNMAILQGNHEFGVFYPLQSLTAGTQVNFEDIPFLIEGSSGETESALMSLAFELSRKVYAISSAQREKVHVAAVFANNFTNHMLVQAKAICDENNIPFEVLHPLIKATFTKALSGDPAENQTGPAIRGDERTIAHHMELLPDEQRKKLYKLITESIQKSR